MLGGKWFPHNSLPSALTAGSSCQLLELMVGRCTAAPDCLWLQLRELTNRCQALRDEKAAGSAAEAEEGRAAAALDTRQAQLVARCEDLGRKIRDLGSLSAEVFEKYQNKGQKVS
eukprot:GHUV01022676.1.p1 GENE.GHUV01022676.1~~GHUV01022676.1.p1  ORF type:complete len:115 (-),score=44.40 GHUV01022676.1:600-944(-)